MSGRVLLSDGTPPTESVVIERVCGGGTIRAEGYTDSRGYFSFELGRNNSVLQDASQGGGFGMNDPFSNSSSGGGFGGNSMGSDPRLMTCDLRARLTGYRSQSVSLANRRPMDNPDVGIILLHRLGANEGTLVSATLTAAPKDARKAYEKGLDQIKKNKAADAYKEFEKATTIYPRHAAAWLELAKLQLAQQQKEAGRASLSKAIEADPKFVTPYIQIALLEMQAQRWQEVVNVTDKAVKLDPFSYPQAFLFNAIANYNLRNLEAAEKSAKEVERLDTRHQFPQNYQLLGLLLAQRRDFTAAAEQFRSYLKAVPNGPESANVRGQLEQVEKLSAGALPKQ